MTINDRIRYLVKKHPKNRRQIADDLFISADCLNNYITGRRTPDAAMVRQMAQYFFVSSDYLLGLLPYEPETQSLDIIPQENRLLELFRSMTPSQQQFFLSSCYGVVHGASHLLP